MVKNKLKLDQEKLNPCIKEQNLTYRCLEDNHYDKEKCEKQVDNYNLCKSFWSQIRQLRKRQGVRPHIPEPKDREKIKQQYFEKFATDQEP